MNSSMEKKQHEACINTTKIETIVQPIYSYTTYTPYIFYKVSRYNQLIRNYEDIEDFRGSEEEVKEYVHQLNNGTIKVKTLYNI